MFMTLKRVSAARENFLWTTNDAKHLIANQKRRLYCLLMRAFVFLEV